MGLSRRIAGLLTRSSWIRQMFEKGLELKARFGAEAVSDLSIGNPHLEPPPAFTAELLALAQHPIPGMHGYMPNAGYPETRAAVAAHLERKTGLPFDARHVIMTTGAGGGMNVLLKAVLEPGDEVIVLAPFFPEYEFYADSHGGAIRVVRTDAEFQIDVSAIEAAISPRTAAVIVNSPNNPTGVVYRPERLRAACAMLARKQRELLRDILLVADEPYRRIVYDGVDVPWIFAHYDNSAVVTSFSKDLNLAGERIGYVALHPHMPAAADLFRGMVFNQRALGMVSAPALMQRLVTGLQEATVDVSDYRRKRDLLSNELTAMGYRMVRPEGAFYLFPEAPGGDDVAFVSRLAEERILTVPGVAFGWPGHFRVSYAVPDAVAQRALPGFWRAIQAFS